MLDQRLIDSVSRACNIEPEDITQETSQANTPTWDSLAQLKLVFEIEDAFGVRLSSQEIPEVTSITRLQEVLARYQAI
jgi:acyl carrier protein